MTSKKCVYPHIPRLLYRQSLIHMFNVFDYMSMTVTSVWAVHMSNGIDRPGYANSLRTPDNSAGMIVIHKYMLSWDQFDSSNPS